MGTASSTERKGYFSHPCCYLLSETYERDSNMNIVEELRDKCVYVHKLDEVVVYVGSGCKARCNSKSERSERHLEQWCELKKEVIAKGLTEKESKDLEQKLIEDNWDYGLLLNRTKVVCRTKPIVYDMFSSVLYYDETSPSCLRWKINTSSVRKDDTAGCKNRRGYFSVKVKGSVYKAHRIVVCLNEQKNISESLVVDHIDNDPSNNKITNLRLTTQSQNNKNKKHVESNTGLQSITENFTSKNFKLTYTDSSTIQKSKSFSYNTESQKASSNPNLYHSRELALKAALDYRQTLVDKGLVVITSDKENNDQ